MSNELIELDIDRCESECREFFHRTPSKAEFLAVIDRLRKAEQSISEWLCISCNMIRPEPKSFNLMCPCGNGTLRPSSLNERNLEQERDSLKSELESLKRANEIPDGWQLVPDEMALAAMKEALKTKDQINGVNYYRVMLSAALKEVK